LGIIGGFGVRRDGTQITSASVPDIYVQVAYTAAIIAYQSTYASQLVIVTELFNHPHPIQTVKRAQEGIRANRLKIQEAKVRVPCTYVFELDEAEVAEVRYGEAR
jgi:hypothetical protein